MSKRIGNHARTLVAFLVVTGTHQAWAQDSARIALWPLGHERVSEQEASAITQNLRTQLDSLVENRLLSASETDAVKVRPEAATQLKCLDEVRCASELGRMLTADRLITGVARMEGDDRAVELRLVDVPGQHEIGRVTGVLPRAERDVGPVLKELAARLAVPEKHAGTLVINGLTEGLEVLVDSSKQDVAAGSTTLRVPLKVGKHNVEIRKGQPLMTEVVDIRFEEIMVLMAPTDATAAAVAANASGQPARPTGISPNAEVSQDARAGERTIRLPIWIGPIVAALAVPPLLVGIGFLVDLFFIGPLALANPSQCQPWTRNSASGGSGLNPAANPGNACGSFWRYTARKETAIAPLLALDVGVIALAGLAAVGLVVVGALLTVVALAPALEDKDAATANKPNARRLTAVEKPPEEE